MLQSMKKLIALPSSQLFMKLGIMSIAAHSIFNYYPTLNKIDTNNASIDNTAVNESISEKEITTDLVTRKPSVASTIARIVPPVKPSITKPSATTRHIEKAKTIMARYKKQDNFNINYPLLEHFTKSSGFGPRYGTGHNGVDIATKIGTQISAPSESVVAYSGWSNGYGRTVILYHGQNMYSLYAHLKNGSTEKLKKGMLLKQGSVFAQAGDTGDVKGAHLHTEIIIADNNGKSGYVVNPQSVWGNMSLSNASERASLIDEAKRIMGSRISVNSKVFTARVVNTGFKPDSFDDHLSSTQFANTKSASLNLNSF